MRAMTALVWACCAANITFTVLDAFRCHAVPGSLARVVAARRQLLFAPVGIAFWPLSLVNDVMLQAPHRSLIASALLACWGLVAGNFTRKDLRRARQAWRDSRFGGWWKRLVHRVGQAIANAVPRPAFAGA